MIIIFFLLLMVKKNNRITEIHITPASVSYTHLYTVLEPIVTIRLDDGTEKELALAQKWPIRVPRPTYKRFPASVPLLTGQRILDTLFPIAKGGTAAVPGGFGTGKTMTQHQIAKWSDADIIILSLIHISILDILILSDDRHFHLGPFTPHHFTPRYPYPP